MSKRVTPNTDGADIQVGDTVIVVDKPADNPYTFSSVKARENAAKKALDSRDFKALELIVDAPIVNPKDAAIAEAIAIVSVLDCMLTDLPNLDATIESIEEPFRKSIVEKATAIAVVVANGGSVVGRKAGKAASTGTRERVDIPKDFDRIGDAKMTYPKVSGTITYRDEKWWNANKSFESITALVKDRLKLGTGTINPFLKLTFVDGPHKGTKVLALVRTDGVISS